MACGFVPETSDAPAMTKVLNARPITIGFGSVERRPGAGGLKE